MLALTTDAAQQKKKKPYIFIHSVLLYFVSNTLKIVKDLTIFPDLM